MFYLQVSNSKTYPNAILLHSLHFNFIIGTSVIQHLINSQETWNTCFSFGKVRCYNRGYRRPRVSSCPAETRARRAGGKTLISSQSREGYKQRHRSTSITRGARGGAEPCRAAGCVLRLAGVLITPPELAREGYRYWFRPFPPALIKG